MRYIDSSSRLLADTLHGWLAAHLPTTTRFACQSGYYRFDALEPFKQEIETLLQAGGRVDLVVGANEARLSAADLEETLSLLEPWIPAQASFTLVGASDGLFHPKTYYADLAGGTRVAAVGSSNFTVPGTGHHIEASILLDDGVDDPTVLDAVRDAILAWPARAGAGHSDARPVTADLIRELEAERAIDPTPVPPPSSRQRSGGGTRATFPALPRIPGAPRSRPRPRPRTAPAIGRLGAAPASFPAGRVGVVKRLSQTDVKGFTAQPGTPYIALPPNPAELAARLPMQPYGVHREPRLDLVIEARLSGALASVVSSGTDPTNITHVGAGATQRSNLDLRFNVLHRVHAGLLYIASQAGLPLPGRGDVVAIEFLDQGRLARLTFATADPLRSQFLGLLLPGRAWGWLPAGTAPRW